MDKRHIWKRITWLIAIVMLSGLVLAACGDDEDDDPTATTESPAGQTGSTATADDEEEPTEAMAENTPESETDSEGSGSDVERADSITGAGASFPAPIYNLMFQQLAEETGLQVNYQSIGSGGGIEQYTAGTVDFGASDAPMTDEAMEAIDTETLHIATVGGSVVAAYNLEGVDQLNLTGEVLADIFLGNITSWDDPAIAELNPDADLPGEDINVVHRSDGSGTTNIFVNYLSAVSSQWEEEVGTGTEVSWPVGSGGQGNEGVTAQVQQSPNSIGYIELAYATENDIPFASLGADTDGPFVTPSLETASNAIGSADIPDDLRVTISATNPIGDDSYPIVGLTWLLVRQEMDDLAVCKAVAEAAWFATHEGQELAPELQYVPIAGGVVERVEEMIMSMTAEGQPCYEGGEESAESMTDPTPTMADTSEGSGSDVEAADSLTGAGASFPAPIYNLIFQQLAAEQGLQVNYQSIGSGGGIEQYTAGTVDFGASDAPMSDEAMEAIGTETLHIATVGGAVVAAYNLEGVDQLNLTGEVLADIFLGNITSWDDPAIAELNPDADLPGEDIQVVHRSDGSGTTNIFVNYLSAVSPQWEEEVGVGTEVGWPVGSGGQGNEGVTAQIQQSPNSIGYIELAYATENDIPFASLGADTDGPFVAPSLETASNAIGSADIPDDLRVTISATNPIGDDSYPIVGLTWLLVRQEMDDLAVCKAVAQAAWYVTHEGQELAPELQYVPIAGGVVEKDEEFIMSMTAEGEPCYSGS